MQESTRLPERAPGTADERHSTKIPVEYSYSDHDLLKIMLDLKQYISWLMLAVIFPTGIKTLSITARWEIYKSKVRSQARLDRTLEESLTLSTLKL